MSEQVLHELSEANLISRAIRNVRPRVGYRRPRWELVSIAFTLGSTYARELCETFGFDPDEGVSR